MMFVWIALGAVAIAALVVGLMSTVFHTATVSVTLSEWKTDVSGTYEAGPDKPLTYTPVSATARGERTVPATGSVDAQDRASGTIVVSNIYSAKAQRLITNTRFESKDGKVYRIHTPITVPGYTIRDGKKVAGTVEAQVYADQPGPSYNTDSATFTLPGLKGSQQYTQITAATKGALSGGFIGKRATVEKSVRDQAVADIKAEIERTLREKVAAAAPPGSTIFPDAISVRYTEAPDQASDQNATIAIDGTAVAPAFPGDGLAQALATQAAIAPDAPLMLMNLSELEYAEVAGAQVAQGGPLSFTLSGTAQLRAVFNEKKFADDLAGTTKAEAQKVRATYSGITGDTTITVRPFWLSTLPKNPERIAVVVTGALDLTR